MKKNRYLLLVMIACSFTTVSAEKLSFCQAFLKLGEQCDDFSPWKGSAITGSYGSFTSNLEVVGALKSTIQEPLTDRSFVAEFGTFDAESKAVEKVESLKKELLTCYPFLKFADTKGSFNKSLSYIVHPGADGFRVYKACLKISKYRQSWDVSFEFPQTRREGIGSVLTKPYTDYTRIKEEPSLSNFSENVRLLMVYAKTGFANVKGEKKDNIAMFDQFKVTFMPEGFNDCYLEDRGMGVIFYEIPIAQNVQMEFLQANIGKLIQGVQQTFGPNYGFSATKDGMSVSFVHEDTPYQVAAVLYIEKILDGYNVTLSLKADPKLI